MVIAQYCRSAHARTPVCGDQRCRVDLEADQGFGSDIIHRVYGLNESIAPKQQATALLRVCDGCKQQQQVPVIMAQLNLHCRLPKYIRGG